MVRVDLELYRPIDRKDKRAKQAFTQAAFDVTALLNLTQKASKNKYGVTVHLADENGNRTGQTVTVGSGSKAGGANRFGVRQFWKHVQEEVRDLYYNWYRAAVKKPKKRGGSIREVAFETARLVSDNAYNFFLNANLGHMNPLLVGGAQLDANGNLAAGQLVDPNPASNPLVTDYLKGTVFYQNKIASQLILSSALSYIYSYQNGFRGRSSANAGKKYLDWKTKSLGADDAFYNAFVDSFNLAARRAGQLNPKGKKYPIVLKDSFENTFFATVASNNTVPNSVPQPSKELLKAYLTLTRQAKRNSDDAEAAAAKALRERPAEQGKPSKLEIEYAKINAFQPIDFGALGSQAVNQLAQSGIQASAEDVTALNTRIATDSLYRDLSRVNDLNRANYANLDDLRRKNQKK